MIEKNSVMSSRHNYDANHDAYFNPDTFEWLEPKCTDPDCEFCKSRPDKHYPKLRSVR